MELRDRIINLINASIEEINVHLPNDQRLGTSEDSVLYGATSNLDSLGLINLIVAIEHVNNSLDYKFDYTLMLQATSPHRNENHIDDAFELLLRKSAHAVISVCKTSHSPLWTNTLPEDGKMDNFIRGEVINTRSQDLPVYYRLNGAIYICKTSRLLKEKTFFIKDNIFAYKMEREHSIDIDNRVDLFLAEAMLRSMN